MILTINVWLSLIRMYLGGIKNYESGDKIRKKRLEQEGCGKNDVIKKIKKIIAQCNKYAPIAFDDLSEMAQETVLELEDMGITELKIELF